MLPLLCGMLLVLLPFFASAGGLLDYQEPGSRRVVEAVLYFRYQDSPWLGQELRSLEVPHTKSLERALVEALLSGPQAGRGSYRALFPPGTQVVNVLAEGTRLFVTFSGEVLKPLPGEETISGPGRAEALLRRELAMASLVNTLTEGGEFSSVQVLVLDQPQAANSMRLSRRYYLEDSDALPDPLTRDEACILTPGKAAGHILSLWQKQDWNRLARLLAASPADSEAAGRAFSVQDMPVLTKFEVSEGSVGFDGRTAIVLLDASLGTLEGRELSVRAFPLRMLRQDQDWLLSLPSLQRLIGEQAP